MSQQIINIGSAPNDGTGDQLRVSFDKSNQNFTELYKGAGGVAQGLWNFDATSTDTSTAPVSGRFKTNSGNYRTATQLAIHATSIQGINRADTLRKMLAGDIIQCQDSTNSAAWCRYNLQAAPVDNGIWFQCNVTLETDGGVASGNNQEIIFVFTANKGGGGGAPTTSEYITATADATLTAERVLTNTATVTWDFSTPGQAKATAVGGGGAATVIVPNIRTIASSQLYTPSPGLVAAIVEVVAGGGGGGGAYAPASIFNFGAGGGAGAYSRRLLTAAQIGASQTITIGAAGAAGAGGLTPTVGGNGGDTSFGSLVVAKGGGGGYPVGQSGGGGYTGAPGPGGSGAAGTGDVTASGAPGSGGFTSSGSNYGATNQGGSSALGGAGALTAFAANSLVGANASNYGSGGSGGAAWNSQGVAGGNGSAGICIVTEFIQQGGAAAAALPGAKVLIQTQTVSAAVASVDFTSGINATYDEYELQLLELKGSADDNFGLQVSEDGGATWKTGASDYTSGWYQAFSTGANSGANSTSASMLYLCCPHMSSNNNQRAEGGVKFWPNSVGRKNFMFDMCVYSPTFASGRCTGSGQWQNAATASTPINAIRFKLLSGGNITGGTFNLYGIKK